MKETIDRRFSVASMFLILTSLAVSISLVRIESDWSRGAGSLMLLLTGSGIVGYTWRGRPGFIAAILWTIALLIIAWFFLPSMQ